MVVPPVSVDSIMCFDCLKAVRKREIDGTLYVRCTDCGQMESAETALDECFVYLVASSVSEAMKKDFARRYRFIPASASSAATDESRDFMLATGRALRAA